MTRSTDQNDAAFRILLVADEEEPTLIRQLAPHLDGRSVELVVHEGDGANGLLEHGPDFLVVDVNSDRAAGALESVRRAVRERETPPAVLLAHLQERSDAVAEILSCAARRLLPNGDEDRRPGLEDITPRQKEILRMVARSYTSREIGEKLEISPRTVETHRANMMQRLGIHDVAGLVRFAIAEGLVEPVV